MIESVLALLVPFAFFQLWPTKGFQYLLPAAPAIALLAARTLTKWHRSIQFPRGLLSHFYMVAAMRCAHCRCR